MDSFDAFLDFMGYLLGTGLTTYATCFLISCLKIIYPRSLMPELKRWVYVLIILVVILVIEYFVYTSDILMSFYQHMEIDPIHNWCKTKGGIIAVLIGTLLPITQVFVFVILPHEPVCPNCGCWGNMSYDNSYDATGSYKIENSKLSREYSMTYYYKCGKCGKKYASDHF